MKTHFAMQVLAFYFLIIIHVTKGSNAEKYTWVPFCQEGEFKLQRGACTIKNYEKQTVPFDRVSRNASFNQTLDFATILTTISHQMVREINDHDRTVAFDIGLTLKWTDHRIKLRNSSFVRKKNGKLGLDKNMADKIWKPEFYVYNLSDYKGFEDSIHFAGFKLSLETISSPLKGEKFIRYGTTVEYDIEAKVSTYCYFEFDKYPMDHGKCNFRFGGLWSGIRFVLHEVETSSVTYTAADHKITLNYIEEESTHGDGMIIGFDIELERSLKPFVVRYYVPCITIVLVSQISFMIPMDAIPGRVALIVTQFLTLVSIFLQQMSESPSKSEMDKLGIYLSVSLYFVVGTLVEFALVLFLKIYYEQRKSKIRNMNQLNSIEPDDTLDELDFNKWKKKTSRNDNESKKLDEKKKRILNEIPLIKIDTYASFVFISGYMLFNVIYWSL